MELKILIICDGSLDFVGIAENRLSILVESLRSLTTPNLAISVETHKRSSANPIPSDLSCYDQLWLICHGSGGSKEEFLADDEVARITEFMRNGGGVFASGDHADLGYAMGGLLPWVRQMRRWTLSNATVMGTYSISTVEGVAGTDQDAVAKRIYPSTFDVLAHPLMRHGAKDAIRWLPDHDHEGDLEVDDLSDFGENKVAVEDVAFAVAWSRRSTEKRDNPRLVPVVKCFDPLKATGDCPGPIVVDSTYHHWIDINVAQIAAVDSDAFRHWRAFLSNLLVFLIPKRKLSIVLACVENGLKDEIEVGQLFDATRAVGAQLELDAVQNAIRRCLIRRPLVLRLVERNSGPFTGRCHTQLFADMAIRICANH